MIRLLHLAAPVMATCILVASFSNRCRAAVSRFLPLDFAGAEAVSDDGRVIAGGWEGLPYVWTEAGGRESIPLTSGQSLFQVHNISGDGSTIVGGLSITGIGGSRNESFRWSRNAGIQLLGRLPGDSYRWGFASSASYDGSVIVGTDETNSGRRAYRWTEATGQVDLGTLGTKNPIYPPFSEGFGLTADGQTVVGTITTTDDEGYKAFRWSVADGFNFVSLPSWSNGTRATHGNGLHISGNGQVVVGSAQMANFEAWTWSEGSGFTMIPTVGTQTSVFVLGVSHDGSTLVGTELLWGTSPPYVNSYDAVIWKKNGSGYQLLRVEDLLRKHKINLHGWDLTEVSDVSADGRTLVGKGFSPSGVERSWYAVLGVTGVPEPTGAMLAMFGLSWAVTITRRLRPRSSLVDPRE